MATHTQIIVIGIIATGIVGSLAMFNFNSDKENSNSQSAVRAQVVQVPSTQIAQSQSKLPQSQIVYPAFFDAQLFDSGIEFADKFAQSEKTMQSPRAVIAPHHLVASGIMADMVRRVTQNSPHTIIIIAPNHYERGDVVMVADGAWDVPWDSAPHVGANLEIVIQFLSLQFVTKDAQNAQSSVFATEHAVGNLIPFIAHYAPQARIVPIIMRRAIPRAQMDALAEQIAQILTSDPRIAIIASIDFAHDVSASQAERINKRVSKYIATQDYDSIIACGSHCADAPQVLVTLSKALNIAQASKTPHSSHSKIIHNTHTANITGDHTQPVTSYLGVAFEGL
jgi:poly-gamma-glutamate synthesis protein (capsule biosynthesis protein)